MGSPACFARDPVYKHKHRRQPARNKQARRVAKDTQAEGAEITLKGKDIFQVYPEQVQGPPNDERGP